MFEVAAVLQQEQNELLPQQGNLHYPKRPSKEKAHQLEANSKIINRYLYQKDKNVRHTLTIPATKAPQLKVPISLGIDINLESNECMLADH